MIPFEYLAFESVTASGTSSVPVYTPLVVLTGPTYALASYTPTIAGRRSSGLTGGGTYDDVEDVITVHVLGSTPSLCVANYAALIGVLDQAAQWWAGENVAAVRIAAEVQHNTAGRLGAIVHGAAPGAAPTAAAPEFDVVLGNVWVIRDVELRFIRRAEWLAALRESETDTTTNNPEIATVTFSDQGQTVAPAAITIVNTSPGALVTADAYLAVTADANALALVSAPGLVATGYTAVANAAALPYQGTNVLRYTPTLTVFTPTGPTTLTTNGYRTWVAIVALRNNSASIEFQLRLRMDQLGGSAIGTVVQTVRSRPVVIDTSTTQPRYVVLGPISVRAGSVEVYLEAAAASVTGPPTLDISHYALVALDGPASSVIRIPAVPANSGGRVIVANRNALYAARAPLATIDALLVEEDQIFSVAYEGDAAIGVRGAGAALLYLQTEGTLWVVDTAAGAKAALACSVSRRRSYLTPQ